MVTNTTQDRVNTLIRQLDAIAADNDDAFACRIEFTGSRLKQCTFVAKETADGHTFVSGTGASIDEAVDSARAAIPAACEEWGYKLKWVP